jgi:hypothetical protein
LTLGIPVGAGVLRKYPASAPVRPNYRVEERGIFGSS